MAWLMDSSSDHVRTSRGMTSAAIPATTASPQLFSTAGTLVAARSTKPELAFPRNSISGCHFLERLIVSLLGLHSDQRFDDLSVFEQQHGWDRVNAEAAW